MFSQLFRQLFNQLPPTGCILLCEDGIATVDNSLPLVWLQALRFHLHFHRLERVCHFSVEPQALSYYSVYYKCSYLTSKSQRFQRFRQVYAYSAVCSFSNYVLFRMVETLESLSSFKLQNQIIFQEMVESLGRADYLVHVKRCLHLAQEARAARQSRAAVSAL